MVAHIGDGDCEIKPFPVREGVPTTMVLVLFTPMFSPVCGMDRWNLIEDECCCTETNEGEDREETENPEDEDIYTAERPCVVTKLSEETVGVRYNIWFW